MKNATFFQIFGTAGLALSLLITPALRPVAAAPAPAQVGTPVYGSVDLDKLIAGYSKKPVYDQQVQDFEAKLDAQFKQEETYDMLSKDQQTQLMNLLGKPTPASQDQATITQLEAQSTKDAQELSGLQLKQTPTDDEKARLQALTQQHLAGQQALKDIADSFAQQVQAKQQALSNELSATVLTAIGAVAKDRGLTMVFSSQVALYSTNDITEDVLKKLNK
jgi:Skp family chaperone for outer membrane proteins